MQAPAFLNRTQLTITHHLGSSYALHATNPSILYCCWAISPWWLADIPEATLDTHVYFRQVMLILRQPWAQI